MHILFLTHYFPPEVNAPATRTMEHARAWIAAGDRVTVVTSAPNHPAGRLYSGYRNRWFQRETMDGVEVIRVRTWLAANAGHAGRILNYLSYFASVLLQAWRMPRADVVVSTSPQFFCGLAGRLFQRPWRPWVLEIRDLWPESIEAVGAMRAGLMTRMLARLERYAYRRADLVVSVTDAFAPHIAERRGRDGVIVVKNGVDMARFAGADGAAFRAEHGLGDRFVAGFAGTHGMAHGLDTLLDAAALLAGRGDIVLLLAGDGADRARIAAERERRGLTNVVILGQQPKSAMPALLAACDAALVPLRKSETFTKVLPSKMFEAMAAGKPIILGVEGEAAALLADAEAGIAAAPGDAAALAGAIRRLADDHALGVRLGANGRAYAAAHFGRNALAMRMRDAMAALVA